jgi:outer membrane lipoprotein carrier protein
MRSIALLALAILLPQEGVSAQDPVAILSRAAARHEALSGFCADFRQVIDATQLRRTVRSEGELCQTSSHLFEMRFTDPAGDRIVADGTHIWIYTPSIDPDQVDRTLVASVGDRFDLHREFLSNPGARYAPTYLRREAVGGRDCFVIELVPRSPSPDYLRARVWIDSAENLVRKIEIHEVSENIRTVEFVAVRLNPTIPAARFRFDPPAGAQVITR